MKWRAAFSIAPLVAILNAPSTPVMGATHPPEKVSDSAGATERFEPPGNVPGKSAFIALRHLRQEPYLCVPTSATMVLARDGVATSPREVKALADGRAYHPGEVFHYRKYTFFEELIKGLSKLGCAWRLDCYALDARGFEAGLKQIKAALDRGEPPLVDTSLYGDHTMAVCGYDDAKGRIIFMDPNIPDPGLRTLTYSQFERIWNSNGVNCHYRAVVLTSAPKAKRG